MAWALGPVGAWGHGRSSWSFSLGISTPGYYAAHCPWCRPYWCGPYAYYLVMPPVYVPPPVVIQPAPVVPPVTVLAPAVATPPPAANPPGSALETYLQLLADPDEQVRLESVTQLGRLRSERAIDPLAATLAGDRSPAVRDAAARALGLIGSPRALPALRQAARIDTDPEVRRSAQYAAEIIQSRP
ncbi:MAG: HEAT repeat domain-containing protein [Gemmataceae bacterium]|nr:HEAT repeat domain-containing protein [Gemmataceae bacterium]MDW8264416.1 HEAT repeat domain-containing protein [Gemmataceae bacterium]